MIPSSVSEALTCDSDCSCAVRPTYRSQAASSLHEEQLHAKVRERHDHAITSSESERRRAERAEARCQRLVAALRDTQRRVVDSHEGLEVMEDTATVAAAQALGRFYSNEMWESGCRRAVNDENAAAAQRRRSRQALRDQLALPGMAACVVGP